jgi:hypothetical protein
MSTKVTQSFGVSVELLCKRSKGGDPNRTAALDVAFIPSCPSGVKLPSWIADCGDAQTSNLLSAVRVN